ncbi:MAG: ferritin-like protein [Nostoc sp.]|uniref:ferritin-like domain-containing protein n=1 Tax=Nostoc sp. TaxID=1180 RepID=UPI002FFB0D37
MLKIPIRIIQEIQNAKQASDIYKHLQAAIELEHSTIPLYLTALYSIQPNSNQTVAEIIFSVVREEMLHMVIAANVLNAIGGSPEVNKPEFIPTYPGFLPMVRPDLTVGLAPLSMALITNTFMQIETSIDPEDYPAKPVPPALRTILEEEYKTIGEFYEAIIDKITELCDKKELTIKPCNQVFNEQWFPKTELFEITDLERAISALHLIIVQGEGTTTEWSTKVCSLNGKGGNQFTKKFSPFDPENQPAHYYRFAQIVKGGRLVPDPEKPGTFVYNLNQPINLDSEKIYPLVENSKAEMYPEGSRARRLIDQFNYSYTSLLNGLHKTFNGYSDYLNTTMGVMFELKLQAQEMAEVEIKEGPNAGKLVAPSFEYQLLRA